MYTVIFEYWIICSYNFYIKNIIAQILVFIPWMYKEHYIYFLTDLVYFYVFYCNEKGFNPLRVIKSYVLTYIQIYINKTQHLFFSLNKLFFWNIEIDIEIRGRVYIATIVNILLWECEVWALTSEDWRKLEVFHLRCCRKTLRVTIYDVITNQELTNDQTRSEIGILTLESYIQLRRARWL